MALTSAGFDVARKGTASVAPGATDPKCTFLAGGDLAVLPFCNRLRDFFSPPSSRTWIPIPGATSGSVSTYCSGAPTSYACQKRCHCYRWPEARWRFSMSIIQGDFTGAIVSRPISIKHSSRPRPTNSPSPER
ncbi:hypothetical protein ARMGADRAFT_1083142 [Armillaria gallica]|uniref:Uncharacterized protein n=1 Tax=Armillaria gallica TaxID=47427 RepID=A0A2H3D848_ARMGA|nr:hypothetical protein ARMGADRAFT_1083142 [Armillaria gallica]